jgi:hypothetical protein
VIASKMVSVRIVELHAPAAAVGFDLVREGSARIGPVRHAALVCGR